MKKGLILITFAWAVEVVGVVAGFVTAVVTTYPDGKLPTSWWPWLMVLPMGMIAVAELGRIPLTSVLFHRHKFMQAIAFIGIVFLAGLAFENWTFGFERIVELRLRPVSEAEGVFKQANADLERLTSSRNDTVESDTGRRKELERQLGETSKQIEAENENHGKILDKISERCSKIRERCMVPEQNKENQRHDDTMRPLEKRQKDLSAQIDTFIASDHDNTAKFKTDIDKAKVAVNDAKDTLNKQKSQNQIFRLAAMWYRVSPTEVTSEQFEFVRFWFSVFSAIAVALAGTVSALVYYAKHRIPGDSLVSRLLAKLLKGRRAYYARKRRPIYRDVPVEIEKEKIVYQDREVPVETIVYKEGPPPPTIVEQEVVKWIDRIVLIPRWGVRYPVHVNSLIKDDEEPPPSPPSVRNVTEIKKVKRDAR